MTRQDGRLWAKYLPIHQVYKLQGRPHGKS
nr:MAG TPA: hypothetical protein [Caudoviricetes sp.]